MVPVILACFVAGLLFGSFANVYFHRVPLGLSLVFPGSSCPSCGGPVRWFDNVPLVSYAVLRGCCRSCGTRISPRYPAVEGSCGVLFAAVAWRFAAWPPAFLSAALLFAFLLFLIAGIDLVTFFQNDRQFGIIPDHLVWSLAGAGFAFLPWNPLLARPWSGPLGALGGAAFLLFIRWAGEKAFRKEALGLGDVKMMSAVGLWLGWRGVVTALIAGASAGSVTGLALIWSGRMDRRAPLPFGPFLSLGCLSALFLS